MIDLKDELESHCSAGDSSVMKRRKMQKAPKKRIFDVRATEICDSIVRLRLCAVGRDIA